MYLSVFLWGTGVAVCSQNPVLLVSLPITTILIPCIRVPHEEKLLGEEFKAKYSNYKKEVKYKVFPGLW